MRVSTFLEPADKLVVNSHATLILDAEQWPVFDIAASAVNYPFLLTEDEMTDLGALRLQSYLDADGQVREWAQHFVCGNPTNTLDLLKRLSLGSGLAIAL